jgi:mRNA interferase MazF
MNFAPDRGDLVWLNFTPQAGHEMKDSHPALVLSPKSYNDKVGLALSCPITSKIKNYPFEVALPKGLEIHGVVLADQIKSLDWRARKARRAGKIPSEVLSEVLGKARALLLEE